MEPFPELGKALKRTALKNGVILRVDPNWFAVVPALFEQRYRVDPSKVNITGGHLAKGHPMGATGAVLLSCLVDALEQRDGRLGMVVATGASGIGAAVIIERL